MIRPFAVLAGLGLLAGCAMPPQGTQPEDLAAFDTAVASIGCDLVGESDYQPVELQTGLSRETVQEIAGYRLARREAAEISTGGIRLLTGACAPEAPVDPAAEGTPAT